MQMFQYYNFLYVHTSVRLNNKIDIYRFIQDTVKLSNHCVYNVLRHDTNGFVYLLKTYKTVLTEIGHKRFIL